MVINSLFRAFIIAFAFYLTFFSTGFTKLLIEWVTIILIIVLFIFFISSLHREKTPIITRYALLMGAEDCVEEHRYTRKVTWLWTAFLFLLLLFKSGLLSEHLNHLFSEYLITFFYIGSVFLFVSEFYIRQLVLPAHKGSSLLTFFYQLSKVSMRDVWQFDSK